MTKRYILYSHVDAGNRGCEAITRSTLNVLQAPREAATLITRDMALDEACGLGQVARLVSTRDYTGGNAVASLPYRLANKLMPGSAATMRFWYGQAMKAVEPGTITLSTGGDIYCYPNSEWLTMLHKKAKKRGAKTVLWGCSVSREYINDRVAEDLRSYDLITARETDTLKTLQEIGAGDRAHLIPDTAFLLQPSACSLEGRIAPEGTVGINLSNFVYNATAQGQTVLSGARALVRHILSTTPYSVLLIPHVYWADQDDPAVLRRFKADAFPEEPRVQVLEGFYNCCQLKYIISNCRYYFGARTHSMIAAYSSGVPAVALGYSMKSKSIVNNLGLGEGFYIDCAAVNTPSAFTQAFDSLRDKEESYKSTMARLLPDIQKNIAKAKPLVEAL